MKSLVLLLCLAQLWGCHSAPHGPGLGYTQLNCDDPETEQAAQVALDYINTNLAGGFKHVLNQIDKAELWSRRPAGEIYVLELDTLETTCHALDHTPPEKCPVRERMEHAVEGDCDVQLLKMDGQFRVLSVKCHSSPDSAEDVIKLCPDCPLLVPRNSTKVVHAVEAALAAFNAHSNGSYFQLVEVSRAQLAPLPPSVYVEFVVAATDCVAKEVTDPTKCNLLAEKQYAFCKAAVPEKVDAEVSVTCKMFQTQPVVPQPQPEGTSAPEVGPGAPMTHQADVTAAAGPVLVAAPPGPPVAHPVHYDLRHSFPGVASVESASGEVFSPVKPAVVVKPGGPSLAAAAVRPCPGRIRHFKI
ncbi:alpha-2-HS-glycoprotein [Dasypus novemcinctus]|uniref:alpha-2-HS-glycoprotein n=1 Tax=Dasypus novemcinctus TaxID=9361 RepID=UPI000328F00F|nr:alpha-2-HS-glycoprotein [Dasypus novemcinctus]